MKKSTFDLMQRTIQEASRKLVEEYAKVSGLQLGEGDDRVSEKEALGRLEQTCEFLYANLMGEDYEGNAMSVPGLPMTEATASSDFSIVFPRVYSQVLQLPKEPNLFLQNAVAQTLPLAWDAPEFIEFPEMAGLIAHEMAEGQEYERQTFAFAQSRVSMRMGKIGVASSLTDEIVKRSIWPLVTLTLQAMSAAIDRRVEAMLYRTMLERARVVFDNNSVASNYLELRTTGVGTAGTWNGSYSYFDLVKQAAVILDARYNASHMLAHPLSWSIWAQDPYLMATFFHRGAIGNGVWGRLPQYDQSAIMPFGLQYVPYYAIPFSPDYTLTSTGSSLGSASIVSDIYVIDAQNSLYLATRGEKEMDEINDWWKDGRSLKARKYAGVAAKDLGRGMTVARNVRMVRNYEAIMTVRTQTG